MEHKGTNLNNETAKKENQFKEDVLNKIKETQINSVLPEVPVENGQNLIPYSSIGTDPSIPPALISVSNSQKRSNETSNMPRRYSSKAYNQSHHK